MMLSNEKNQGIFSARSFRLLWATAFLVVLPLQGSNRAREELFNTLIQKYSPVFYLHPQDIYLPVSAEEYCTNQQTRIIFKKGMDTAANRTAMHRIFKCGDELFSQKPSMQCFYDMWRALNSSSTFQVDKALANTCIGLGTPDSVDTGALLNENTDARGNLTTPAYTAIFESDQNIYIQFFSLYAYNGPSFWGCGGHKADLEHVTLEIDQQTYELKNMYFSAHTSKEGRWVKWGDVQKEKLSETEEVALHPIVFVAHNSHACYPQAKTYWRYFGFGNDVTKKGLRWTPKLVRLRTEVDPLFDVATMGWIYFPGTLGDEGVASLVQRDSFLAIDAETGRPVDEEEGANTNWFACCR